MSHHQTRSNTYLASHLFSVKISLAEVAPIAKFHKSHKIGKICSVGKTRKFVHKCQMQSVRTINTIISYYIILSIQYSAISPYLYTFLLFHRFNMNFKHCNKIYIKHLSIRLTSNKRSGIYENAIQCNIFSAPSSSHVIHQTGIKKRVHHRYKNQNIGKRSAAVLLRS